VPTQALWQTIIGAGDAQALRNYPELRYVPAAVRQGWLNYIEDPRSVYYGGDDAHIQQQNRMRLLSIMYEEGVDILLGTDAPQLFSVPGLSLRRELPLMAAAGMSNYDILRSGTERVGAYFASEDQFGTLTVGSRADILLVQHNPLEQLSTVYEPAWVIAAGRAYSAATIAERLAEIAAAYAENE
jgi:cytosine/adenosine deaminase-related metal-dependent hydrolase